MNLAPYRTPEPKPLVVRESWKTRALRNPVTKVATLLLGPPIVVGSVLGVIYGIGWIVNALVLLLGYLGVSNPFEFFGLGSIVIMFLFYCRNIFRGLYRFIRDQFDSVALDMMTQEEVDALPEKEYLRLRREFTDHIKLLARHRRG